MATSSSSGHASGHRQLDHTADLALELWAASEAELLVEGMRALIEIITEGTDLSDSEKRLVEIHSLDAGDRLVQWLNEIIYGALTRGFLPASGEITLFEGGLRAVLHGEAESWAKIRTELKSATYSDLEISGGKNGWRARVVIDV